MSDPNEEQDIGPLQAYGLWATRGVPKKGWSCVDTEDLGSPVETCQMCQRQRIRFVHYMEHPRYPQQLACGCVCAEYMEEGYADPQTTKASAARERERKMRNRAGRRKRWLGLKGWTASRSGNGSYIKKDGHIVMVFRTGRVWRGRIRSDDGQVNVPSQYAYATEHEARAKSFDGLMFVLDQERR